MKLDNPRLQDELAARYVIGTLRGAARARFARVMERDAGVRARVIFWEERFDPLAQAVAPVTVPERVWQAVGKRLGFAARTRSNPFWPAPAWAAAVVLGIAIGAIWQPLGERLLFDADVQVVLQDTGKQDLWRVELDVERDALVVHALREVPVGPDKSLELWLLRPGDQPPISLGLLPTTQDDPRRVRASATLAAGNGLAVSLEPRGGSPTKLPTGPVLYVQMFDPGQPAS